VKILSGVIFINKFPYKKIFCFNKICIELPAFKHQTCLFKRNTFRTQFDRFKAGTGYLIGIPPRMGAAKIENIPVLFLQKTERKIIMFLRKLKSQTLGADKTDRDGFVPKNPQSSPAGGHGIETGQGTCRDKHPFAVDTAEEIIVQRFRVDCFK